MKIYADPIQMQNRSNSIRTVRAALENNMEQIESLVISINGSWQGDAERAYASRILFVKKEFSGIMTFLDDYATLLEAFSVQYDEFDSNLAAKINLT